MSKESGRSSKSQVSQKSKKLEKSAETKAATAKSKFEQIQALLEIMNEHDLLEIEWENQGQKIKLKKKALESTFVQKTSMRSEIQTDIAPQQSPPAKNSAALNERVITAPLVGTFYRSASPTSTPYVKEGQEIKTGEVICLIEAMKLMNEIESEVTGRVKEILVENGQPVEFGAPLFIIQI